MDHLAVRAERWRLGHVRAEDGIRAFRTSLAFVGVPSACFFNGNAAFAEPAEQFGNGLHELEGDFDFEFDPVFCRRHAF
jgi:hypothetical protein